MTKRSETKHKDRSHSPPSDGSVPPMKGLALFPDMTSCDYQRLNRGEPDQGQIKAYGNLIEEHSREKIMAELTRSMSYKDAAGRQKIHDLASKFHHENVWDARLNLVAAMNRATLDSLAKHYEIEPGDGGIRNHPAADDLDRGPILKRLQQFLWWYGEYLDTAPEMLKINVEEAHEAAEKNINEWNSPGDDLLEEILRKLSSAPKRVEDTTLVSALMECIALECVCPCRERRLNSVIRNAEEEIGVIQGDGSKPGKGKMTLESLERTLGTKKKNLLEVREFVDDFNPGKVMPDTVREKTDKWFASQFNKGKRVNSVVRVAWLIKVFGEYWRKYEDIYSPSQAHNPKARKMAAEHGKKGVRAKADKKWRKSTSLFVDYIKEMNLCKDQSLPDALLDHVDRHCKFLLENRRKGFSDERTIEPIRNFLRTLIRYVNQASDPSIADEICSVLRNDPDQKSRTKGKVIRNPYTNLTVDTVLACLNELCSALRNSDHDQRPDIGTVKKKAAEK